MEAQLYYNLRKSDFNLNGYCLKMQCDFLDLIQQFEKDFKGQIKFAPNYLLANSSVMEVINSCFSDEDECVVGMEPVSLEENFKIEEYSDYKTIYAISSVFDDDDPLYLVINNDLSDNEFILKYSSYGDDDDDEEQELPVTAPVEYVFSDN